MASFKLLTEGKGYSFENKYGHPFTGSIGSYQLITTQYLAYPFIPTKPAREVWNEREYVADHKAMMSRVNLVWFYKEFVDSGLQFDETDWA